MGRNSLIKGTLRDQYLSACHKTAYWGKDHPKSKQAWSIYFYRKKKEETENGEDMGIQ